MLCVQCRVLLEELLCRLFIAMGLTCMVFIGSMSDPEEPSVVCSVHLLNKMGIIAAFNYKLLLQLDMAHVLMFVCCVDSNFLNEVSFW